MAEIKAFTGDMIMTGAATKVDGSLALRFSTGELNSEAKVALMELQNKVLSVLIQPKDELVVGLIESKGEFDRRTPGQRLRACLYIEWSQMGKRGDFQRFYEISMENLIDTVKQRLTPVSH